MNSAGNRCGATWRAMMALAWGGGTVWYARRRGRWPSTLSARLFARLLGRGETPPLIQDPARRGRALWAAGGPRGVVALCLRVGFFRASARLPTPLAWAGPPGVWGVVGGGGFPPCRV